MVFFVNEEEEAARLAREQEEEEERRKESRRQLEEEAQYRQQVLSQITAACRQPRWQRPAYIDQFFAGDHGLGAFLRQELPKKEYGFYQVKVKDFFSADDCVRVQVTASWTRKGWELYEYNHPMELAEEEAHQPPPPPPPRANQDSSAALWLLLALLGFYLLFGPK